MHTATLVLAFCSTQALARLITAQPCTTVESSKETNITMDFDFSQHGMSYLSSSSFDSIDYMHSLNLSRNEFSSTEQVVEALTRVKPQILDLSHNNLGSELRDQFTNTHNMIYRQNKVLAFDSAFFWSIDVSNNSLLGLGIDFDAVYLNLSNNLLHCHSEIELRFSYRDDPIHIWNLDLSNNSINCQYTFRIWGVHTLNMSRNELLAVGPGIFKELTNLTTLNLGYNKIRSIHPNAFQKNTALRYLQLNNNHITEIYMQTWITTRFLNFIDLSDNRIKYLDLDFEKLDSSYVTPLSYDPRIVVDDDLVLSTGSQKYFRTARK